MSRKLAVADIVLCCIVAFILPLWQAAVPALVSLWVLVRLVRWGVESPSLSPSAYGWASLAFFLLYLIGVLYSDHWERAWSEVETKTSFLVLPWAFVLFPSRPRDWYRVILAFLGGCFLAVMFYSWNLYENQQLLPQGTGSLYGSWFVILMHPGYFALYLDLALLIIVHFLYQGVPGPNKAWRVGGLVLLGLVFLTALFLTGSKAGILIFFLGMAGMLLWIIVRQQRYKTGIGILLGLIVGMLLFTTFFDKPIRRYQKAFNKAFIEEVDTRDPGSTEVRLLAWQTTWELYKTSPVFGIGTGDVKPELKDRYREKGYDKLVRKGIDPHDQYLETLLAVGIPGLIALLGILGVLLREGWRRRDPLLVSFVFIIAVAALFESIFEKQAGVVFFNFFAGLLYFSRREEPSGIDS